jgi:aspartyl-tRNA(Asn)/glutamyl-tRNA(Gln) amidotransferase subunit A
VADSAIAIAADVRSGRRSARDVLEQHLAQIDARESDVHAFNLVTADAARARADEIDAAVARGENPGPLAGVPIALKDNLCTRGVPTTCSSRIPRLAAALRRHGRRWLRRGRGHRRQDEP